jgi:glucokinase
MNNLILGIDIGGSSIKYGWGNSQDGLQEFHRVLLAENNLLCLRTTLSAILEEFDKNIDLKRISAIGIGVPGMIDTNSNKIVGVNPNLPDLTDINPVDLLPKELRSIAFADNDANLMALGESYLIDNKTHILGITIGSGIGSGFVLKNEIYHGAHGYAMEIGHNNVCIGGLLCNCGKKGCLEAYASVSGMLNQVQKKLPLLVLKDLNSLIKASEDFTYIKRVINTGIEYLAISISNLALNLDADVIVIGGGAVEVTGYPMKRLQKKILDTYPNMIKKRIEIRKAQLGNKSGVFGAICFAEQKIFEPKE